MFFSPEIANSTKEDSLPSVSMTFYPHSLKGIPTDNGGKLAYA